LRRSGGASGRPAWEVEIAGKNYPAIASMKPLYDPTNEKVKC
jgi:hypothetical protein